MQAQIFDYSISVQEKLCKIKKQKQTAVDSV
jgi:hypothetical protein